VNLVVVGRVYGAELGELVMAHATTATMPNAHAAPAGAARKAHSFWLKLMAAWFASYRPERHYMRGPGPKWHEKHGSVKLTAHENAGSSCP
jgi:hypothetical protein